MFCCHPLQTTEIPIERANAMSHARNLHSEARNNGGVTSNASNHTVPRYPPKCNSFEDGYRSGAIGNNVHMGESTRCGKATETRDSEKETNGNGTQPAIHFGQVCEGQRDSPEDTTSPAQNRSREHSLSRSLDSSKQIHRSLESFTKARGKEDVSENGGPFEVPRKTKVESKHDQYKEPSGPFSMGNTRGNPRQLEHRSLGSANATSARNLATTNEDSLFGTSDMYMSEEVSYVRGSEPTPLYRETTETGNQDNSPGSQGRSGSAGSSFTIISGSQNSSRKPSESDKSTMEASAAIPRSLGERSGSNLHSPEYQGGSGSSGSSFTVISSSNNSSRKPSESDKNPLETSRINAPVDFSFTSYGPSSGHMSASATPVPGYGNTAPDTNANAPTHAAANPPTDSLNSLPKDTQSQKNPRIEAIKTIETGTNISRTGGAIEKPMQKSTVASGSDLMMSGAMTFISSNREGFIPEEEIEVSTTIVYLFVGVNSYSASRDN